MNILYLHGSITHLLDRCLVVGNWANSAANCWPLFEFILSNNKYYWTLTLIGHIHSCKLVSEAGHWAVHYMFNVIEVQWKSFCWPFYEWKMPGIFFLQFLLKKYSYTKQICIEKIKLMYKIYKIICLLSQIQSLWVPFKLILIRKCALKVVLDCFALNAKESKTPN